MNPQLPLLDEPTTSLDPPGQRALAGLAENSTPAETYSDS
jgi:energy-coupling factor transporter ATP-binding protein EcfA2